MCAVGRCLINPKQVEQEYPYKGVVRISDLDSKLKPEYRDLPIGFWMDLQDLHDDKMHWVKKKAGKSNTLNEFGTNYYNGILSRIKDNRYS